MNNEQLIFKGKRRDQLTDLQRAKLDVIRESMRERAQAIMASWQTPEALELARRIRIFNAAARLKKSRKPSKSRGRA
jgi:hypothetical protein